MSKDRAQAITRSLFATTFRPDGCVLQTYIYQLIPSCGGGRINWEFSCRQSYKFFSGELGEKGKCCAGVEELSVEDSMPR
jgi:hypothetical protein